MTEFGKPNATRKIDSFLDFSRGIRINILYKKKYIYM